ncbi:hypothetical protein [Streptomyces diastatochromogenes]|uniref:hypothetical protein n=1 Tax=Streptomyces diastatochromogenes TaxID=42236 RepID=UPI00117D26E9|nr:hypothetical protein [Streptomyces diastatochromogenes]MCZ0988942.1 hypothetical protein [Streptomyces diastatochromogenes]
MTVDSSPTPSNHAPSSSKRTWKRLSRSYGRVVTTQFLKGAASAAGAAIISAASWWFRQR